MKCRHGVAVANDPSQMPTEDYLGNKLPPFYRIKSPAFWSGTLTANGKDFTCELLEDATWYAVRTLQTRLSQDGVPVWHRGEDWNTLPYDISYVRVPLSKGVNYFDFLIRGYRGSVKMHSFSLDGTGRTYFKVVTSLDSYDPNELNK